MIPPTKGDFMLVNDREDVSLRLDEDEDQSAADLIILDMQREDRGYGWFIAGIEDGREYEMPIGAPFYFPSLAECCHDAIQFLENHAVVTGLPTWLPAVPLIRLFLAVNMGAADGLPPCGHPRTSIVRPLLGMAYCKDCLAAAAVTNS